MKLAELQTLMESLMDRVGRLEGAVADTSAADTVVSHHSRELDRQTDLLHEIRQIQAQHSETLGEVAGVQAQHSETLGEVAAVQAQHTDVLRMITDHLRITDAS
jgi:hypothetical protein